MHYTFNHQTLSMNKKIFTQAILICCLGLFLPFTNFANCPGCIVDLPQGMAEDTLYLDTLPNGAVGNFYDADVGFRMPKTTTPVNILDPDIPAGLTISQIEILGLSNLPPGISWEANETTYDPSVETDGCMKFCGTPLQAGLYIIEVTVEATIVVFTQQATFYMEMLVEPSSSITEGFSMLNNSGCGEVTVSFQNNIPSNGEDGFSYQWDFGNGNTSNDENPQDQTYSEPGIYIVDYQAEVDTVGFILTRAVVTGATCDDIPTAPDWSFNPDMHIEIRDPSGNLIYNSQTVWNTAPPVEYFPNIELGDGNYSIKAVDEDSGINGSDDICGEATFNKYSNGPLITGDFNLHLDIIHPVEIINSSDTVWVFEIPDVPELANTDITEFCEGEMVIISSSYDEGNQWFKDSVELIGETNAELAITASGVYSVVYTNEFGCSATSEEIAFEFYDLPEMPEYHNVNNLLTLLETITYPGSFTFQWYQDNQIIDGETDIFYCAMEDGEYMLEVTDPETGCTNYYIETIIFDPQAECFTATEDLVASWNLKIFPNPAIDVLNISFELDEMEELTVSVYDLFGRRHYFEMNDQLISTSNYLSIDLSDLVAGMYLLEINSGHQSVTQKFVKK